VASNRPQVLILCNKQDHALSKGPQVILNLIEKEMYQTNSANVIDQIANFEFAY
jgi:signal recognition particle receptor subunit beta